MRFSRPALGDVLWAILWGVFLFGVLGEICSKAIAFAITIAAVSVELFRPKNQRNDSDQCGKCGHQRLDHHGPCQACLRAVRDAAPDAPATPCSRFAGERHRMSDVRPG